MPLPLLLGLARDEQVSANNSRSALTKINCDISGRVKLDNLERAGRRRFESSQTRAAFLIRNKPHAHRSGESGHGLGNLGFVRAD